MPNELNISLAQSQTGLSVTAQKYLAGIASGTAISLRSEEHTSELQSRI